ncbi:MAG: hypothetical protein IJT27_00105 [Clostridia bacterium]|nr:hypothetical protein [Clostridia bacterium]
MANYSTAYAFDMFETANVNTAPKRQASPQKAPQLKKVPGKTKKQVRREQNSAFFRSVAVLLFACVALGVICLQISAGAKRYELARQIAAVEQELQIAQSENVRLHAELNSVTSIDKICAYASDELGMVKAENYQIECIDLSEGDSVLYAGKTGFLSIFSDQ